MPRVEVLTEVSGGDPEAVLTEHVPSEMLADERDADQLVERMRWAFEDAERQQQMIHAHDGGSAAGAQARSVRRATARRASNRRATVRATARRASSTFSPSTRGAPRVISPMA
jgi:hypothetical protein